ncbi:MAG: hypothetical protein ACLQAT_12970 [Candidatus Binataceae bacterium]
MLTFESRRFLLWRERTIYFPSEEAVSLLPGQVGLFEMIRVSQSPVAPPDTPYLMRQRLVRTTCLDLTKGTDAVYKSMDAKSCRYVVRRGEQMSSQLKVERNEGRAWADFIELYNGFVARKGYAKPFARWQVRQWAPQSDVFVIYKDGRAICAHLLVRDRGASRVRLILSASRRLENAEDSALAGILNRYLHWREIQCYSAEGIALFDLGGLEDDSSPITKFKLSFGGVEKVEHSFVLADRVTLAAHALYRRLQRWYKQPRRQQRFA